MVTRGWMLGALLLVGAATGTATAQVTSADYERAAGMLGDRTTPLLDDWLRDATWLDDGSVVYALVSGGIPAYLRLDPATGKTMPAFDLQALAAAVNTANPKGKQVEARKLVLGDICRPQGQLFASLAGQDSDIPAGETG